MTTRTLYCFGDLLSIQFLQPWLPSRTDQIQLPHCLRCFTYFFMPGPIITFRSARKLCSYLVRAKLYSLEKTVGSCKCYGKRYEVCDVTETSTVTITTTQNTYNICQLNCRGKCLVYLLNAINALNNMLGENRRQVPSAVE